MLHYDTFVFSTSELISMQERQQHCARYTVMVVNKNMSILQACWYTSSLKDVYYYNTESISGNIA